MVRGIRGYRFIVCDVLHEGVKDKFIYDVRLRGGIRGVDVSYGKAQTSRMMIQKDVWIFLEGGFSGWDYVGTVSVICGVVCSDGCSVVVIVG